VPQLCCRWLYPFTKSLAAFLHKQRKKEFFFFHAFCYALTRGTSRACPGYLSIAHLPLLGSFLWSRCAGSFGEGSLFSSVLGGL